MHPYRCQDHSKFSTRTGLVGLDLEVKFTCTCTNSCITKFIYNKVLPSTKTYLHYILPYLKIDQQNAEVAGSENPAKYRSYTLVVFRRTNRRKSGRTDVYIANSQDFFAVIQVLRICRILLKVL